MTPIVRAKAIVTNPLAEWSRIEQESGDAAFLLSNYVAWLALVPAACGFIGASLIGTQAPGSAAVRAPMVDGLFGAIFGYVETVATVLLLGLFIDLLAPVFGARREFDSAFKLAVYSYTPVWLTGIFLLLPGLRFLILIGFYGAYLLALGLPILMKSPPRQTLRFAALIVFCAWALTYAAAAAQRAIFGTVGL